MCMGFVGCFLLRTLLLIHRLNEFYTKQIKPNPQILETAQNAHFSFGHWGNSDINLCVLLLLAGVMWVGEICAIFCIVLSGILSARMTAENDSFQQPSLAQLVITWLMTVNCFENSPSTNNDFCLVHIYCESRLRFCSCWPPFRSWWLTWASWCAPVCIPSHPSFSVFIWPLLSNSLVTHCIAGITCFIHKNCDSLVPRFELRG